MWPILVLTLTFVTISVEPFSINCGYGTASIWATDPNYYCDVTNYSLTTSPKQWITSVNGTHISGFNSNTQVNYLQIGFKIVHYLPQGIVTQFPNLQTLGIYRSNLKTIKKYDIQLLTKLRILHLNYNDLESLQSDLFVSNTMLEQINLQDNRLKIIGQDIVKPLLKLWRLNLIRNVCIDKEATSVNQIADLQIEVAQKCVNAGSTQKVGENNEKPQGEYKKLKFELKKLLIKNQKATMQNFRLAKELKTKESELIHTTLQFKSCDENLNAAAKNIRCLKNFAFPNHSLAEIESRITDHCMAPDVFNIINSKSSKILKMPL